MNAVQLSRRATAVNARRSGVRLPGFRVVAIAIRRDGTIVTAVNGVTPTPERACHAEVRVLRKAGVGATVYVLRYTKAGAITMAKPCPACELALKSKKAREVVYSDWSGELRRLW